MKNHKVVLTILGLIASLFAVGGVQAATSTSANVVEDCIYFWTTDYKSESWAGVNTVEVGMEVKARNCLQVDGTGRRVQPIRIDYMCRSRGPGNPNSVIFNPYFYDGDGHSYNPDNTSINCDDYDWNTITKYPNTSSVDWFHLCDGGPPRWRGDVKIDYPWPNGGDVASLASTFWGYTGPTPITC